MIFKIILGSIVGGTGIYKLIEYIIKKRQENKAAESEAKRKRMASDQEQDHKLELEMFEFDKEKYLDRKDANEKFQKEIINEIFSKFVSQSEWVREIHDKSVENIEKDIDGLNKAVKDIYVQNDVMSNRLRNIEDRLLKNTSIIIAKLDTLIKLLAEPKNDKRTTRSRQSKTDNKTE